jgi:hypothetical protein
VTLTVRAANPNDVSQTGPASTASAAVKLLAANSDEDGDGQTNAAEQAAGMNPRDNASVFKITNSVRTGASSVQLTWTSVAGKNYEVWATSDLALPFVKISGASSIPGAGSSTVFTDTSAAGSARFYQVRTAQ